MKCMYCFNHRTKLYTIQTNLSHFDYKSHISVECSYSQCLRHKLIIVSNEQSYFHMFFETHDYKHICWHAMEKHVQLCFYSKNNHPNCPHGAVRRLMNTFKVDGLTRALTRQLENIHFLSFS